MYEYKAKNDTLIHSVDFEIVDKKGKVVANGYTNYKYADIEEHKKFTKFINNYRKNHKDVSVIITDVSSFLGDEENLGTRIFKK